MDRLETFSFFRFFINCFYIYIPVWIDQKPGTIATLQTEHKNLHSSMDRLETIVNNNFLIF